MGEEIEAKLEYCSQCESDKPVRRTVPWQPDICTACGADIETDD